MESARRAGRVLIIEDDPDARANLRDILELDDYAVDMSDSLGDALDRDSLNSVEVIIVDRQLPEGSRP